jgi:hypothetical protein
MSLDFTNDFDTDLAKFTLDELAREFTRLQQLYMADGDDSPDMSHKNYVEDLYVRKQMPIDVEMDDAYGGLNVEEIFNKEVDKPLE